MNQFTYYIPCSICGGTIYYSGGDNKPYNIDDKPVCRECYYNKMGDLIEQYPIGVHSHKKQHL